MRNRYPLEMFDYHLQLTTGYSTICTDGIILINYFQYRLDQTERQSGEHGEQTDSQDLQEGSTTISRRNEHILGYGYASVSEDGTIVLRQ